MDDIPTTNNRDVKLDCIHNFVNEYQIDILALMELNTAWDLLPYTNCLPVKTHGWWEVCHWSVSHNKQDKFGNAFQPGRTAIMVLNQLAHKTMGPGNDPSGLGRWSWVQLWGKQSVHLISFPLSAMQVRWTLINISAARQMVLATGFNHLPKGQDSGRPLQPS